MCSFVVKIYSVLTYNVEHNKSKEKKLLKKNQGVSKRLTGTVQAAIVTENTAFAF